ncbi:MAG TPA: MFS transporter, partial [Lacipirellulaceae bacterium]|nr:MFS transporter [Lacipirellulaceae bacterium]
FLTAHGVIYGISKFTNGIFGDRINARWFMSVGLAVCAVINIAAGMTTTALAFGLLWAANGWAQGVGYPPCARLMTHWFRPRELATKMGVWNISHSLGAGLIAVMCGYLVVYNWRFCFFVPAGIVLVGSIWLVWALRDTPESLGFPPMEGTHDAEHVDEPLASTLRRLVFANRSIWILSIANFFVYAVRYGLFDWGPTFLRDARGIDLTNGAWFIAGYEGCGLVGMLVGGWITDRMFQNRPARACLFYMIPCSITILLFWLMPNQSPITSAVLLCLAGFFVYGPQSLIGAAAANLATKRAAAAAVGLTGLFGYLSTTVSGVGIGVLVHRYGWNAGFMVFAICGVVATLLFACCWTSPAHGYAEDKVDDVAS